MKLRRHQHESLSRSWQRDQPHDSFDCVCRRSRIHDLPAASLYPYILQSQNSVLRAPDRRRVSLFDCNFYAADRYNNCHGHGVALCQNKSSTFTRSLVAVRKDFMFNWTLGWWAINWKFTLNFIFARILWASVCTWSLNLRTYMWLGKDKRNRSKDPFSQSKKMRSTLA